MDGGRSARGMKRSRLDDVAAARGKRMHRFYRRSIKPELSAAQIKGRLPAIDNRPHGMSVAPYSIPAGPRRPVNRFSLAAAAAAQIIPHVLDAKRPGGAASWLWATTCRLFVDMPRPTR